jgi:heterotetrameric sarcosine oxidase gamma subunit
MASSALHSVLRAGRGGEPGSLGVKIAERRDLSIVQISVIPGVADNRAAIEATVGTALPAPNKSAVGRRIALWTGPARWFVVEPGRGTLADELDKAASGSLAITDLSHSRTVLRVSGPKVRDVVAQGCSVDLHPRAAKAGDCFVTSVARHSAVLHVVDDATMDVYVYRSFGQDLCEWLLEAASPYGYEILERS